MKNGIFVLLFLLLTSSVFGNDSCKNVNLSREKKWGRAAFKKLGVDTRWNSNFKQMPLYNQGATGICYAYAAVQLADYWRETMGIRVTQDIALSSPIYASLLTRQFEGSRFFGRNDISGGGIKEGVNSIKHFGMCRDDVIQRVVDQYAKSKSIDQREFTEILELLFVNFPGDPKKIQRMSSKQVWNKYIYNKFSFYYGRKIKKDGKIADIFKLVAPYIENGNIVQLMNDLFKICKDPRSVYINTKNLPDPKNITIRKKNIPAIKSHMRELLNKKRAQPIGVGYCSKFLNNKNYIGTVANPKYNGQMTTRDVKTCGNHASIIIGKRNIGGKCHYLLRNTWGDECDYDWKCRYNAKKQAIGIWVPEDALFKNLTNITWLERHEYLCLAKNRNNEQVFGIDKPKNGIADRQGIDLFNKTRYLLVKVDAKKQNKVRFLYGKSSRSMYTAKEFAPDHFKTFVPIDVSFNYKRKNLDFKLTCLPNEGSRSQLIKKLRSRL
jgi:hypothetical protein